MNFSAGPRFFYKPCFKKCRLNIWVPTLIQRYECTFRYETVSYSNLATMILVHCLSQIIQITYTGKPFLGISPTKMELIFCEYILGQQVKVL